MADRFVRPRRMQVEPGTARRQRRHEFFGESRKTEDFGRSNLWRPIVVDRMRGSRWPSALLTGGSKWVQAQPARWQR